MAPQRVYYPANMRVLQNVKRDKRLTIHIQHNGYAKHVQNILLKSEQLQVLSLGKDEMMGLDHRSQSFLQNRGELQRCMYKRDSPEVAGSVAPKDLVYEPRDRYADSDQATNVYQTARLLQEEPFNLYTTRTLASILRNWGLISGFHTVSTPGSLTDLIECPNPSSLLSCHLIRPLP